MVVVLAPLAMRLAEAIMQAMVLAMEVAAVAVQLPYRKVAQVLQVSSFSLLIPVIHLPSIQVLAE